jgi:hypothetical protein
VRVRAQRSLGFEPVHLGRALRTASLVP